MTQARYVIDQKRKFGYFTRVGGVSTGIYEGLNIGTGSKEGRVMSIVSCARAGIAAPAASATPPIIVKRRGSFISNLVFMGRVYSLRGT